MRGQTIRKVQMKGQTYFVKMPIKVLSLPLSFCGSSAASTVGGAADDAMISSLFLDKRALRAVRGLRSLLILLSCPAAMAQRWDMISLLFRPGGGPVVYGWNKEKWKRGQKEVSMSLSGGVRFSSASSGSFFARRQ